MTLQLIKRPNYLVDESTVILHKRIRALPNASLFLKSMQKNSRITGITYETSLSYFQSFLDIESKYDLQTVLETIAKNEINVYTLLEQFVTFLTDSNKSLSPGTVRQYVVGFRPYLAYYDIDVIILIQCDSFIVLIISSIIFAHRLPLTTNIFFILLNVSLTPLLTSGSIT